MQVNVWRGAIPASLVAVAGVLLGAWIYAVAVGQDPVSSAGTMLGHLSFFAVFFGWPLALAVSLTLGALLRQLGRDRDESGALRLHCLTFAAAAAVIIPLLWAWLWGSTNGSLPWIPLGALVGASAGAVYWRFGRARRTISV